MSASELKALVEFLRQREQPPEPDLAFLRDRFEKLAVMLPVPGEAQGRPTRAGGRPAEWVAMPGSDAGRCVLYLHGGGYALGSITTHRTLCCNLARAASARVLSLDYRLAPEHPFPAALEDAVGAWRWLLENGVSPARAAIAGDSAGGGLTVATLVALKEQGLPLPAAAVVISPWIDLQGRGKSMAANAARDPLIQREILLWFAELYLDGADPKTPLAAPLHADLAGLPPLLIQVGDAETLLDDSTRLARRAKAAGVDVTCERWPDMIHVWHLFAPMLSEGMEAIEQAGAFVRAHTPAAA